MWFFISVPIQSTHVHLQFNIAGLTTGKEVTAPLGQAIAIKTVTPWDGKDAPVPEVEEEEFSLEDILGEEL